ncbi:restriction endonuclease subunit S [Actinomyces johnsonii]|uniref:restriction endonuclease subunit S n=1 Tax=Actinomyces johnsonii TaxID=544581 RepID=UPI0009DC140F|nr:restriction endonuclease subunit S [Actinomyces johnsonii]
MSRIDDLIRDLHPNGVERIPLCKIATFNKGSNLKELQRTPGPFPVVTASRRETSTHSEFNFEGESITISTHGAYAGFVSYWNQPIYLSNNVFLIKPQNSQLLSRYLYHYLKLIQPNIQSMRKQGGIPYINTRDLASTPIPKPSLEIQAKIVDILDQFTQLEAELEVELEARQQQYAYYRDILVAPRSPRESVKLGEVSRIARGASPRPIRKFITNDGGIPWIKIGDVPPQGKYITTTAQHISTDGAEKSRQIKPGDFILSNSMSFGRPYISKINGCIHDGWLVISNYEKTFDPDFLYHVLRSSPIQNGFAQRAGSGTVRNLNSRIVSETLVPAPPIDQQRETVHLLDKFDLLVNDLTSGLPAEIEARHKQYEYYRDRLLTFPEKN